MCNISVPNNYYKRQPEDAEYKGTDVLEKLKTREELLRENRELHSRICDLEKAEKADAKDTGTQDTLRKLSVFIESNPNPVIELDSMGSVTYCNRAAEKLAGTFGDNGTDTILPSNRNVIVKRCLMMDDSERHVNVEIDGRTVSWSFYPLADTGTVYCHGSEITEKLRLEKQLAQSQKMEAVGSLAGGIAHDFNNLLTAIKGYADLALNRADTDTELYRELKEIHNASVRASKLTRQLLVFSKTKEVKLEPMEIN